MKKADHPPICDYEGSDYQKSFWDEGARDYEDRVEAVALQRLLPSNGDLMLEIGAGAGRNTPRYHGYNKIVVLDYSLSQIQLAQERLGRNERYIFVAADVYRLPFVSGLFDSATMIRVLHHLAEPVKALIQVRRVLQPSGIFILEFANKQNLKAITRYVFGLQDWNPFTQDSVEFVHLNFDFHPSAISQWLTETNFLLQRQLTVSHFRIGWLKKLVPTKLLVWFDSIAQLTGDLWQLTPSVFTKSTAIGMIGSKKPEGDSFFRCPICEYALPSQAEGSLICAECGTSWPFLDGIYDFRILDQ